MIDNANPRQIEWLKLVNAELGNQITSNAAFMTEISFLNIEIKALREALEKGNEQNRNMGMLNANLREENIALRAARGKKAA